MYLSKKPLSGTLAILVGGALVVSATVVEAQSFRNTTERHLRPGSQADSRVARPSYGGYFYQPTYQQPIPAAIDAQRAYSYEPQTTDVGDVVVITREAKVMRGREVLGVVAEGQKFKALKVEGPWVGGRIEIDGRTISGWILNRFVAPARGDATADAQRDTGQAPVEVRAFSYEPAQPLPIYRQRQSGRTRGQSLIDRKLRPGSSY